ncbi:hypothetical protein PI125_g10180 [Phytophthora idaei]|nr:hypothetical protein PI125_g10180 [Phytophthora idaei]KAG3154635.1 hypothetical protein PI126_g9546 [Phytophthora idaei]
MESGDEDEFFVDDDEESDVEAASEDWASEDESTTDEEDAVDLSAGTPFDRITREQLSNHAMRGWHM